MGNALLRHAARSKRFDAAFGTMHPDAWNKARSCQQSSLALSPPVAPDRLPATAIGSAHENSHFCDGSEENVDDGQL